jgi:hypothetical protein
VTTLAPKVDPLAQAEHALHAAIAAVSEAESLMPPGLQDRARRVVCDLVQLADETSGPLVRWRRWVDDELVEILTGRLIACHGTDTEVAIRTDDGFLHTRIVADETRSGVAFDLVPLQPDTLAEVA